MKQTYIITIDSEDEIQEGQIGVPIMRALKLDTVKVDKAAQHSAEADACYCCRDGGCQEGCRCWKLLPEEAPLITYPPHSSGKK